MKPVDFVFWGRLNLSQEGVNIMLSMDFGHLSAPQGSGKPDAPYILLREINRHDHRSHKRSGVPVESSVSEFFKNP
jgi:hypothetical protein